MLFLSLWMVLKGKRKRILTEKKWRSRTFKVYFFYWFGQRLWKGNLSCLIHAWTWASLVFFSPSVAKWTLLIHLSRFILAVHKGSLHIKMNKQHIPFYHRNLSKLWEIEENREAWCDTVHRVAKSRMWLSNWTTTKSCHHS